MPDWNLLVAFALAAVAISLVPGPDMLFVLANSVGRGARVRVLSATGISLAMVMHTTAAALGLSLLFERSAWAFDVVRYAGAAYLVCGAKVAPTSADPDISCECISKKLSKNLEPTW